MSNYNDTSKLPICDKHRHEVINHALREEVIPLTVGMKLEQTVETLRELLQTAVSDHTKRAFITCEETCWCWDAQNLLTKIETEGGHD
jgi:hypothetical protein